MKKPLLILLALVFLGMVGWDFSRFVDDIRHMPKGQQRPVELMAVLTGGKGRLHEALVDFARGDGKYLLISGVGEHAGLDDIVRANEGPSLNEDQREKVVIDTESHSTYQNVRFILNFIKEKDLHSVALITSNYHVPRTKLRFLREKKKIMGDDRKLDIEMIGVESPNVPMDDWWESFTGWRILISEYFKIRMVRINL